MNTMPAARRARVRVNVFRLAVVLVAAYSLVLAVGQQVQLMRLQRELRALSAELHAVREEKAAVAEAIRKLNDPAVIEREARRKLGLARPGEIQYLTLPADAGAAGPSGLDGGTGADPALGPGGGQRGPGGEEHAGP